MYDSVVVSYVYNDIYTMYMCILLDKTLHIICAYYDQHNIYMWSSYPNNEPEFKSDC